MSPPKDDNLSDYTAIVGRKKSERWVKKSNRRGNDYDDDDYEWDDDDDDSYSDDEDVPSVPAIPTEFQAPPASSQIPTSNTSSDKVQRYALSDGNEFSGNPGRHSFYPDNARNSVAAFNVGHQRKEHDASSYRRMPSGSSVGTDSQIHSSPPVSIASSSSINPYASNTSASASTVSSAKPVPSLFLPSQHKRHAQKGKSDDSTFQRDDREEDPLRQSTNSFVTAYEQPSYENLNERYSGLPPITSEDKDEDLSQTLEKFATPSQPVDNKPAGNSTFAPKLPASTSVFATPNINTVRRDLSGTPSIDSQKPLSSSTPEPQNSSFGNDSTLSQEALSSDSTTTLQVSNERSFSSEPRSSTPKLGSTFKEPHNPANNEVTVDELAKSISAEFASLEFSQPIAKSTTSANASSIAQTPADLTHSTAPAPTSSDSSHYWARKDTFPSYDDDDDDYNEDYVEDFDDTIQEIHMDDGKHKQGLEQDEVESEKVPEISEPIQQEQEAEQAQPVSEAIPEAQHVETSNSLHPDSAEASASENKPETLHKRDFSLTSYLDDYYNDDDEDADSNLGSHNQDSFHSNANILHHNSNDDQIHGMYGDISNNSLAQDNFTPSDRHVSTSTVDTVIKPSNLSDHDENEIHTSDSDDEVQIVDTAPASASKAKRAPKEALWMTATNSNLDLSSIGNSLSASPALQVSDPSELPVPSTPKLAYEADSLQNTPNYHGSGASGELNDSYKPLPMPNSRFGGGRFSTASDSLASFGGNETDDTASLSTGRISPQSFIHSNRESYDFRTQPNVSSVNSSRSGAHDSHRPSISNSDSISSELHTDPPTLDQIKKEIPGPTSPSSKIGKWKSPGLDYISEPEDFTNSPSTSVQAVVGTNGPNSPAPIPGIELDSERNGSSSDLTTPSNVAPNALSNLRINETHRLPSFSTYVDFGESNTPLRVNSGTAQDDRDLGNDNINLNTTGLSDYNNDSDNKDTPVASQQKALEREINDLFTTSRKGSETSRSATPLAKASANIDRTITSSPDNGPSSIEVAKLRPGNSASDSSAPHKPAALNFDQAKPNSGDNRVHMFSDPMTPMEPDPEIAALYRDQSQLLHRPISQLLDPESMIPTTRPLSPTRTRTSVDETTAGASVFSNLATLSEKDNEEGKTNSAENEEKDQPGSPSHDLALSPSISITSDFDEGKSLDGAVSPSKSKTHSRSSSAVVRSLILSPQLSPVQSVRTKSSLENVANRRSSLLSLSVTKSLIGRNQSISRAATSLSTRINRPPVIDFHGILSRAKSVDRKAAFDAARQAQVEYDSGLQTWLVQFSADHDLKSLGKSASSQGAANKKPGPFLKTPTMTMTPRMMTSALSEVSNKTQGLANRLHINKVGEKSSSAAKGFFSRSKKFLQG